MSYWKFISALIIICALAFIFLFQSSPLIPAKKELNTSRTGLTIKTQNLDTPWAVAFLPDDEILVTQRSGELTLIKKDGRAQLIQKLSEAKEIGEGGLLGLTLHPQFPSNHFIYVYYTYEGGESGTYNKVVRYRFENNAVTQEKIIINAIPGAPNHNGGRIAFGPDGYLYVTTGDAQNPSQAQSTKSLAGKILRVTDEGTIPADNPFDNAIYSYGHRNPQGIAWNAQGDLWATEHGRSGIPSGLDELNKIEKGKNYGWPIIQGNDTRSGMENPVIHSASDTWAPAGLAFKNGLFYFAGLRGSALYIFNPNTKELTKKFDHEFGRLREVITGPDGALYISTSNKDGRGKSNDEDDKILKID